MIKIKFPVDSYDLKARYAPALIISLPVLITLWSSFLPEIQSLSKLLAGILSAAILYLISVMVRAFGKNIEPGLWESWGGAPSNLIVSWKNQRIGEGLKEKYHECVRKESGLPMPDKEMEEADSEKAQVMIQDAFKKVKGIIRQHDKDGLWSIANAEYGFARNLYGSRWLWLILSVASLAASGYFLWADSSRPVIVGFVLLVLNFIVLMIFFKMLPGYTKQVAFRYAEHAWESYCNVVERIL